MGEQTQHGAPMCSLGPSSFDQGYRTEGISISLLVPPSAPSHILTLFLPSRGNDIPVPFLLSDLPFFPPLATPTLTHRGVVKGQVWQCWKSWIEVGNKWKQASASDSTGPRAQGPTSHPQWFFLLLTMCYDWVAESPTANDSNSAQS